MTQLSIYEQMVAFGVEIDNHESDMYVEVNETTTEIVRRYKFKAAVGIFRDNANGKEWYDIPFAYAPYWDKRERKAREG